MTSFMNVPLDGLLHEVQASDAEERDWDNISLLQEVLSQQLSHGLPPQRNFVRLYLFFIFTCGTQVLKQSFQNTYSNFDDH